MKPITGPPTVFSADGPAFWLALAILWFASAQALPWFEPDEGRYAEIPREMAASGDWVTPRLDGLKYFEKPPLQYWATAAAYKAFGVSEWTSRLWSLALAFLCLPLTYAWVKRGFGRDAGLIAVAVLTMSPFFVLLGHVNLLDSGFTFWLTATLFAFTLAQAAPPTSRAERGWMLAAWAAAALAVLSKGIVVAPLAGFTLMAYSVVQKDWRPWRRLHLSLGIPLFLLLAAPWFIAVSLHNPEFPKFFFLHEHFARFLTTVHRRTEPWWYFLLLVVLAFLPWIRELPRSFLSVLRRGDRARGKSEAGRAASGGASASFLPLPFLAIYAAVVLAFFSASQSKLAPYILPMLPPLAALIGIQVANRAAALRRAAWVASGALVFVALGLVLFLRYRYDVKQPELEGWALAAAGMAGLGILGAHLCRSLASQVFSIAAAGILSWQLILLAHAAGPLDRSAHDMLVGLRPYIDDRTRLYGLYEYRQTVPPYLGRTMTVVGFQGELDFGMTQEPGRNTATLQEFLREWQASDNAIAFVRPGQLEGLQALGMSGRVVGQDHLSIAVSRR